MSFTFYWLGRYEGRSDDGFVKLSNAVWVADTGRPLGEFLKEGAKFVSCEYEYVGDVSINVDQIVSYMPWVHGLEFPEE